MGATLSGVTATIDWTVPAVIAPDLGQPARFTRSFQCEGCHHHRGSGDTATTSPLSSRPLTLRLFAMMPDRTPRVVAHHAKATDLCQKLGPNARPDPYVKDESPAT